jgi:phospholipase C
MTARRNLLKLALGSALLAGAGDRIIRKAVSTPPGGRTGSIMDVEHVVILMQENRSFDHYFGTLRGVRGFGDPRPVRLPSGQPVWFQPYDPQAPERGHVLPFRLDARATRAEVIDSLDHSWKGSHARWKRHDAWIPAKSPMTMGHFTRADLPFYYALADAFTICDAYHCSIFGPTTPNRNFLFSGTNGLGVADPGPLAIRNVDAEPNETAEMANDHPPFEGFEWTTYAERLQAAGVSWKVYQEYDNYGDNNLAYYKAFRGIDRASPLYLRGRTWAEGSNASNAKTSRGEHLVAAFRRDVAERRLPQVSWIVAPYIMCEHPKASPSYGETLTARLIETLADHPEVWSRTVFILNYDENDGFFDHVPPPVPAIEASMGGSTAPTTGEVYGAEPVGLGPRVPMLAISPWSRGGWVNSELFDHTSVIRFLERRFEVDEPNISPWRRSVCGDLTSAFDFARHGRPPARLPDVSSLMARSDAAAARPAPRVPALQALPAQEPGVRPARPLPYALHVHARVVDGELRLQFVNDGSAGAVFSLWPGKGGDGPWFYTVGAGKQLAAVHPIGPDGYDFTAHGPNGFLRRFAGPPAASAEVAASYGSDGRLILTLSSPGKARRLLVRPGVYGDGGAPLYRLRAGETVRDIWDLSASGRWYDLIVTDEEDPAWIRRLSGHIETGEPSITDPAIGQDVSA